MLMQSTTIQLSLTRKRRYSMEDLWGKMFVWEEGDEGGKQAMKIINVIYTNETVKE